MPFILPNEDLQVVIREALNEDVNTRDRDLQYLKTWLKQQPHLPDVWDETGLMNFLRGCHFSMERAKKKIDMYFTMRAAVPEFFSDRDITKPNLQTVLEACNAVYLPGLTPDGKRVAIAGLASQNDFSEFVSLCKYITMVGDIRLVTEMYGVTGDIYVLDAKVSVFRSFLKISPVVLKKFFICIQEAYPVRIKEVHVINSDSFVTVIINAVKPLLKEKLRNRIHLHDSIDSLYDFVPKKLLPEEYGGGAGKLSELRNTWVKKLEEFTPWFEEQEKIKADESKRIGKLLNYDNLFGIDGSFRQLTID